MPEVISDTSPLQYLFQVGLLDLLPRFYGKLWVPEGVSQELDAGRAQGVALPDLSTLSWLHVRKVANQQILSLVPDLDVGEREALALALEMPQPLVILDDALARRFARRLDLAMTGTLGILLRAKREGHIPLGRPILDRLKTLKFRVDEATRAEILALAAE